MPGGHEVDAEPIRPIEERTELDVLVAARTWVRRPAGLVLPEEIRQDRLGERRRHVHDLEGEPADAGHRLGVGAGARPAAAVVHAVGQVHQVHVGAEHFVALLGEQAGRDGGVDPARHRNQHGTLRAHGVASLPAAFPAARYPGALADR
jgi:hypothetical protein